MIKFEAVLPDASWKTYATLSEEMNALKPAAKKAFHDVVQQVGRGSEWLGWRRILQNPQFDEIELVTKRAEWIRNHADTVIVAGIGGSYLGAKAILDALSNPFQEKKPEILFAGFHMGAQQTRQLIDHLKTPIHGQKRRVHLIVISKSGSTIETAITFRALRAFIIDAFGDQHADFVTVITGPEGGKINDLVAKEGYTKFVIPDDVGGRFSVLTPVGLLPLAVAGVDVLKLVKGAVEAFDHFEHKPEAILDYAAFRLACYQSGIALDVIGSFEPELTGFSSWIQQLMGESEGKELKGIFPIGAAYSTDLHSLGQMIQEGQRNLMETFLTLESPAQDYVIPFEEESGDGLDYVAGRSLFEVNQMALKGTVTAHSRGGVPVALITLPELHESSLGAFIYFYELVTAVYGYMLGVNPFDQPGVEAYKLEMRKLLDIASA